MITTEDLHNLPALDTLIPDTWQSHMVTATDGADLHLYRTGDGSKPALVLVHGFMSGAVTWLRVAPALAQEFDIIMPDARGHGQSRGIDNGFSLDILADDLHTIITSLAIDKPIMLGHSMGADTVIRFSQKHPELPQKIILVEPPTQVYDATHMRESDWYKGWVASMLALKTQTHAERMQNGMSFLPPGAPFPHEADYVAMVETMAQFNTDVLEHSVVMPYIAGNRDIIGAIQCPILLMTGDPQRGSVMTPDVTEAMLNAMRDGLHKQFNESGHFIHWTEFEEFIVVIKAFASA